MKETVWKTKGVDWRECENALHHVYLLGLFPVTVENF